MQSVVVTVVGVGRAEAAPELATVRLRVVHEGADRDRVYAATVHTLGTVRASLAQLEPRPDVVADQVMVRSHRPVGPDGRRLEAVHHGSATVAATFDDHQRLAEWLGDAALVDGVEIDTTEWRLRPDTQATLATEARTRAVRDAQRHADAHASALGLSGVEIVSVTEQMGGNRPMPRMAAMAADVADLAPGPAVVSIDIEATFELRGVDPSAVIAQERAVWDALVAGDPEADHGLLSDDFVGVYPTGLSGRADHVGQLAVGPSVAEYRLSDERVIAIGPTAALVVYRADYRRVGDEQRASMYVSSLWQLRDQRWVNTFSQDTPADGTDVV